MPHGWRAPWAAGASWPRERRSRPAGPAPGPPPAVAPPSPAASTPSSRYGRTEGQGPGDRGRNCDAVPRAASPAPAPSPLPPAAAFGRAPAPRPRSAPTPWPRPRRNAGGAELAPACARRSPRNGPARSTPPPPRSGPAGPALTATRAAVSPALAAAPAGPRNADRVAGTPAPSHPGAAPLWSAAPDSAWMRGGLVLTGLAGDSWPIRRALSDLRPDLVLHGHQENSCHEPNQVSDLHPDLVLREVPGNLVERSPHSDRRREARYRTLRRIS